MNEYAPESVFQRPDSWSVVPHTPSTPFLTVTIGIRDQGGLEGQQWVLFILSGICLTSYSFTTL